MFYHALIGVTGITSMLSKNNGREEVLNEFLCPFLNKEVTLFWKKLYNMSSFGSVAVYETERVIDTEWPLKKVDFAESGGSYDDYKYRRAVEEVLPTVARDVTEELFREALVSVETKGYREYRTSVLEGRKGRESFFVCPFGNDEVDHNYEFVVKPVVRQHQFGIAKADEISHTGTITSEILSSIARSRFLVADLTDARPNCYYEVGYAHALGKPVVILAKEGTQPQFDIATYKWTFWTDYRDLKPKLQKELDGVLVNLGLTSGGG